MQPAAGAQAGACLACSRRVGDIIILALTPTTYPTTYQLPVYHPERLDGQMSCDGMVLVPGNIWIETFFIYDM
jgi:hypothetical protein